MLTTDHPLWFILREKIKPTVTELETLAPSQRVKFFEMVEEIYCSQCGWEQWRCQCHVNDKW